MSFGSCDFQSLFVQYLSTFCLLSDRFLSTFCPVFGEYLTIKCDYVPAYELMDSCYDFEMFLRGKLDLTWFGVPERMIPAFFRGLFTTSRPVFP
jgi:hypothetical protein